MSTRVQRFAGSQTSPMQMSEAAPTAAPAIVPSTSATSRSDGAPVQAIADRTLRIAYRTALGITRNPHQAADIAQDVAVKALRHRLTLRDPSALTAWVHRTTVRTAIDAHRVRQRQRTAETRYAEEPRYGGEAENIEALRNVLNLLAPLPYRQRAAMTLRFVHDLTDREIADALGCRTGTARSLLSRATATLRAAAGDEAPPKDPR